MNSSLDLYINKFFKLESAGGILLVGAAAVAIIMANTFLNEYYELLLSTPVEIRIGELEIAKPLLLWINDGLMAIFFFLVGLELKRELVEGELSDKRNIILPGVGAIGGMLVPALIYFWLNKDDPVAVKGWAIPAATDIAFALGVLTLLGSRVPTSLKIFLTSLAIFDDVGAIVIIAVFYAAKISVVALAVVAACLPLLFVLNKRNVVSKSPYLLIGLIMWVATLKSGRACDAFWCITGHVYSAEFKRESELFTTKKLGARFTLNCRFFYSTGFCFCQCRAELNGR